MDNEEGYDWGGQLPLGLGGEGDESEFRQDIPEEGYMGKLAEVMLGVCFGIVLFLIAMFVLGWNENHYVCEDRRILFAEAKAEEVGCDASNVFDTFSFFSCPLDPASLTKFEPCYFNPGMQCDNSLSFRSVAGRQLVEMYQCVESCSDSKKKNRLGQNVKVRTCDYSMDWKSTEVLTGAFHQSPQLVESSCPGFSKAQGNPRFPENLQIGESSNTAQEVRTLPPSEKGIGYMLNHRLTGRLTPDTEVDLRQFSANFTGTGAFPGGSAPWTRPIEVGPSNLMVFGNFLMTCAEPYRLGCVRISYYDSDTTSPSVIAKVTDAGETEPAALPGSWGCSPTTWQAVKKHDLDKAEMITALRNDSYIIVWFIRLVGCILACVSVWCCLQTISSVADVIADFVNYLPCGGFVQDFVEDLVDGLVWLVACNVGLACSFLMIATVWVAMRPFVGAGLMLLSLLCCCFALGAKQIWSTMKGGSE